MKKGSPVIMRSNIVRFGLLASLLIAVQLVGCASAPPAPPEPPLLWDALDGKGLALLECSMVSQWKGELQTNTVTISPSHCALGKVGEPAVVIPGDCWDGQLIFSGLEPGEYFLKLVEGIPRETTGVPLYRYVFREGVQDDLVFTLAAGDVLYLGSIRINEGHKPANQSQPHTWTFNKAQGTDHFRFSWNRPAEEYAWSIFLETYGDSPWGPLIRALPGEDATQSP